MANLLGGDSRRSSISRLSSLCFSGASSLVPTPLCPPAGSVAISLCPLSISTVAILISGFFFFPILGQARPGLEPSAPPGTVCETTSRPIRRKASVSRSPTRSRNAHALGTRRQRRWTKKQGPPRAWRNCAAPTASSL
jgi:hypothetical protein